MISPHRSTIEYTKGDGFLIARVPSFDITIANNAALVPTAGYSVGSFQLIDVGSAALSTGVVTAVVSNDPQCSVVANHPTPTTLSAAGATEGIALEHAYFGAKVTTIQGTAGGSSVLCELWIYLKA